MDGSELLSRARAGDAEAFGALTEPHRRELHAHCYRMLGSYADAEDALQDTMLAAWRGLDGFAERASTRTWLFRIATNKCLDARRAAGRRPALDWNVPGVDPPPPTGHGEVVWLEPYPEDPVERREVISLAFVRVLQRLPPRQVAVLLLRDVLGFSAKEVADILDTTVESVTSALKRARAALPRRRASDADEEAPAAGSHAEAELVARFVRAWEAADVPALVALLADEVFVSMPPMPFEYVGRDAAERFFGTLFGAGRRFDLLPTRANGQPAFGAYLRTASDRSRGVGLYVLTLAGDRIQALARFEDTLLPVFGLPAELDRR